MTRIVTMFVIVVAGGLSLAACATGQNPGNNPAFAPYSETDNPFCGAVGNCAPASSRPYPMRGTAGGF
jgi:hypothetical protein